METELRVIVRARVSIRLRVMVLVMVKVMVIVRVRFRVKWWECKFRLGTAWKWKFRSNISELHPFMGANCDNSQFRSLVTLKFFYLKLQNCITFLQQWTIYGLNALTRDHVNNFWDTSTPIHQTKSLVGTYTGPLHA